MNCVYEVGQIEQWLGGLCGMRAGRETGQGHRRSTTSDLGFGKEIWATEWMQDQSRGQVERGRLMGGSGHPEQSEHPRAPQARLRATSASPADCSLATPLCKCEPGA